MHIHGSVEPSSACRLKESVTPLYIFCPVLLPRPRVPPDDRNVPPLNRIGDPDDILASVRVEGRKESHYQWEGTGREYSRPWDAVSSHTMPDVTLAVHFCEIYTEGESLHCISVQTIGYWNIH